MLKMVALTLEEYKLLCLIVSSCRVAKKDELIHTCIKDALRNAETIKRKKRE